MKNITVARRYARALYELAQSSKTMDDVSTGMSNVVTSVKSSPELGKLLVNPLVKPEEKVALIKIVTSNKLILKLVELLARRKRLDLMMLLHDEFQHLFDRDNHIHRVLVKTAAPLSDPQKKDIEKNLAGSLGGTVMGRFEVAKELIGGVWIKLGDKVLDATLKGRMDDLRFVLAHSVN
jgi:F-type H+-transporting ATPase subunit delta